MDIQRPIPRQKLRADWGRAVADAVRAQGLDGPGVLRTPGGTSLPPGQPPGVPMRPPRPPFCTVFTAKVADGEAVQGLTVRPGHVWWVADDATTEVPYVGTDGDFETLGAGDGFEGETWADYDLPEGDFYVYASVTFSGGLPTSWTLKAGASLTPATGRRNYPVALVTRVGDFGGLAVEQLRLGEFILGPGAAGGSGGDGEGEGEGEGEGGGSSGGGGGEGDAAHWGATGSLDIQNWTTGPNAVAASGTRIALPGVTVAAGSGGAGGVAATLTPTTRHFSVDTMGNVREISAPTGGTPIQVLNGANGQNADHWGDITGAPAVNLQIPTQFDVNESQSSWKPNETLHGGIVTMSQTWIDLTGRSLMPGGRAFRIGQQQLRWIVDTRGNVRQVNKSGYNQNNRVEITYPQGTAPNSSGDDINASPSANPSTPDSAASATYPASSGRGKVLHLTRTWLDGEGRYCQQHVALNIDTHGAIRKIAAGAATKSSLGTVIGGFSGTLLLPGVPTLDASVNGAYVYVPIYKLTYQHGLLKSIDDQFGYIEKTFTASLP